MMSYVEIRITPKDIKEYEQKMREKLLKFLSEKDYLFLSVCGVEVDDSNTPPDVKEDREKRLEAAKKVYDEFKKEFPDYPIEFDNSVIDCENKRATPSFLDVYDYVLEREGLLQ